MKFLSRSIPFINTTWVVAHHPFASPESGWRINPQQTFKIENLFEKGVRGFMIDIHYHQDDVYVCHENNPQRDLPGNCWYTRWPMFSNPVKLNDLLESVYNIIIDNPNDIITLFLECYVPMIKVAELFSQNNLTQFLLKINPNNASLTIGDIISRNTPLIVFSDYAHGGQRLIEGFFYTKYHKESKYNLAEYQGCEDRNENSRLRYAEETFRGIKVNLFLLNHFYEHSMGSSIPGISTYHEINDYYHIKARAIRCENEVSLFPNFIAVDYVEQGNWGGVFAFANEQNYKTLCALTRGDCIYENNDTNQDITTSGTVSDGLMNSEL
jgi:hypothetical protein